MRPVVLLIDEDAGAHAARAAALAERGLACVAFTECSPAWRWLQENLAPAVVVIDLALARSGALMLCEEMRRAPRLRRVPMILTVRGRIASDDGLAQHLDAMLLEKPFTAGRFCEVVQRALTRGTVTRRWRGRPRLLIADDDPNTLDALAAVAHDEGWDPLCAPDGAHALDLIGASPPPRLAIIDWILPGGDGVTVASRISTLTPERIPIVLMSGHEGVAEAVKRLDGALHLKKPFPREQLITIMQRAESAG